MGAFRYLPLVALATDLALMTALLFVAGLGRAHLPFFDGPADVTASIRLAGPLMLLGWLAALFVCGSYRRFVFGAGTDEFRRVVNGSLLAAGIVGVGAYLFNYPLSRGFFVLTFALGAPALLLGRALIRSTVQAARRRGTLTQRVVIAGSLSHVDEVASVLSRESWLGYKVVGAVTPANDPRTRSGFGIPVLGNSDDIHSVVPEVEADVVFIAGGAFTSARQTRRTLWSLEQQSAHVVMAPSVTDISSERVKVRPVGGLPLIHIDPPRWADASRWGKRAFDLFGSSLLIVAFAPLFAMAAWRVRRCDGGPILFRQTRTGRHGEEFSCLKFRTMVTNAEELLAELHAQEGYESGLFKMKDDPRITKPGKWLRRFSIDELPQLFNVFAGDMSLVGPRPPLPHEVALYEDDHARRLHVRPGMTGLWQVNGRSDLSNEEAMRLDLYYVDNWSMLQDLSILARTLGAVLGSRGAY